MLALIKRISVHYLFIAFGAVATAADYYVNDGSTVGDVYTTAVGSAANDGLTPATPKASLQNLINAYTLGPGDNIYVDAGSYVEVVDVSGISGTAANYISFIGADSSSTIFIPPTAGNDKMFHLEDVHYTLWSQFKIDGTAPGDDYAFEIFNDCSYNIVEYFQINDCYYGMDMRRSISGNPPRYNHFRNSTVTADWVGVRVKSDGFGDWLASSISGPHDNEVYDNKIFLVNPTGTGYSAIESQAARNNLFYRNHALANCMALVEGTVHSAHGTTGNTFINNYLSNMNLGQYSYDTDDSSSVIFIHNSFYSVDVCWKFDGVQGDNIDGCVLRNNIFESLNSVPIQLDVAGAQFKEISNNMYYSASNTNVANVNGVMYDLAAWQAYDPDVGTGNAANSLFGDPNYIDPSQALLDLACFSPAINAVVSQVSNVVVDIYNTPRPVGLIEDIGAHELPNVYAGDVTPDESIICSGDSQNLLSEGLDGNDYVGAIVTWEQAQDGFTWGSTDGTFTRLTDSTGTVTRSNSLAVPDTMYYRLHVACFHADTSDTVMIITNPIAQAGDVIVGGNVCLPNTITIEMNNEFGDSIYWETRSPGGSWTVVSGETSNSITVAPLADANYRAIIKYSNQVCEADTTNEAIVTVVNQGADAGEVIPDDSICIGSSQIISMVNEAGDSIYWEQSITGMNSWSVITGETGPAIMVSPNQSIDYRGIIKFANEICSGDTTNEITIVVHPTPISGQINGGTICPGDDLLIQLTGYQGDSIYWEESAAGMNSWSVIAGENSDNILVSPAIATDYRAFVKYAGGLCTEEVTNIATVLLSATATAGSFINGSIAYCTGDNGTLNLTVGSGATTWEESKDGITFGPFSGSNVTSTSATVNYTSGGTQNDTTFVRVLYSTSCVSNYSDTAMVIVHPTPDAGSITGGTICPGDDLLIQLTGYQGDSIYWEQSAAGLNSWSVLVGETADNILVSPAAATDYRAFVKYAGGLCLMDMTNTATVAVDPIATPGTFMNSPLAYCSVDDGALNLTVGFGNTTWEESNDGIAFGPFSGSNVTASSAEVSYTNTGTENDTTWVRVRYETTCNTEYSDTASVIIHPTVVAGSIAGGTICPGDNQLIQLIGYAGDSIYWEQSAAGLNSWSVLVGETADNILVSPATATDYRAFVKYAGGLCSIEITNTATVTVSSTVTPGSFVNAPIAYCTGGSDVLNISAGTGTTTWEESSDRITFGPFAGTNVTSTSATVNYTASGNQHDTTWIRVHYEASCVSEYSDTAMIIVHPAPVAGQITGATICLGNEQLVQLTGHHGDSIYWEESLSGSENWSLIVGESVDNILVSPVKPTDYRAFVKYEGGFCISDVTNTATVQVDSVNPSVSIFISDVCEEDGQLEASITSTNDAGQSPTFQWQINGNNVGQGEEVLNTTALNGDIVNLIMNSSEACSMGPVTSDDATVFAEKCECSIWIPTAISPNEDGLNDSWQIAGLSCWDFWKVSVYNRYGSLVWEQLSKGSNDKIYVPWNGERNGKSMPVAVYYYVIEVSIEEQNETYSGQLTIMR